MSLVRAPKLPASPSLLEVGGLLRAAREASGLSVAQVAEQVKIREYYVRAIEHGTRPDLPEDIYVSGYVRTLAAFLNVDLATVCPAVSEGGSSDTLPCAIDDTAPPPLPSSGGYGLTARQALVGALVALVIAVGLRVWWHDTPMASRPEELAIIPAAAISDTVEPMRVILVAHVPTALQFWDDRHRLTYQHSMQAGDTYMLELHDDLRLSALDPDQIHVFFSADDPVPLGTFGAVLGGLDPSASPTQ